MTTPTKRQGQFLAEYQRRAAAGEPPPTFRELGEILKLASTNSVAENITALIRKGYLRKHGAVNASRSIVLTDLGRKWKTPVSPNNDGDAANNSGEAPNA